MAVNQDFIRLLNKRDETVLNEINNAYGKTLKNLAFNILKSRSDAEECVNDTLLDVWNTIPPQKPESILSYACMILRRRAIDRIRYYSAERRKGTEYDVSLSELEDCIADDHSDMIDEDELADALNGFIEALPYKERNIFMSRYYGLESIDQIADKHNISKNAVNIRLNRIRNKLKNHLSKRGICI